VCEPAAARLVQLFPACFYVARRQRRPLKIRIHRDLAVLDLEIGRRGLNSALPCYVNGIGYLQAGAARIGLDGAPAGVVSEADEARAGRSSPHWACGTSAGWLSKSRD
jgi:sRNA-binding protein